MLTLNCTDLLMINHNNHFFPLPSCCSRAMQYSNLWYKPSSPSTQHKKVSSKLWTRTPQREHVCAVCGLHIHKCITNVLNTYLRINMYTHSMQPKHILFLSPSQSFRIYLPVMFSCLGQIPREDVDKQSSSSGVTWTPTSTGLDALLSSPCEGEGGLSTVLSMHMLPLHCFLLCSIKMRISPKGKFIWHWPQVSRSWSPSGETCTSPWCSCLSSETTDDRGSAAHGGVQDTTNKRDRQRRRGDKKSVISGVLMDTIWLSSKFTTKVLLIFLENLA